MTPHPHAGRGVLARRRAGILLHPTSLPGGGVHGTLGPHAYRFVDLMAEAGLGVWQTLPLGPPHEDRSPYQCMSVHAANTQLISLEALRERGWLDEAGDAEAPSQGERSSALRRAAELFRARAKGHERQAYEAFLERQQHWLDDYVLYLAIRDRFEGRPWWEWEPGLRDRDPAALEQAHNELGEVLEQFRFEQFLAFQQWQDLKAYAHQLDIALFGDMPIFVAHDSADVWARRELFDLDETGQPRTVAGVPPDYFSETGQRWGNPHYDWERMRADGFAWWRQRIASELEFFDLIRVDHFRGFSAFWAIPGDQPTAAQGYWVEAPGAELFEALRGEFGELPLVAEDLGIITPEVEVLRDDFGLPGMKVLQFAFDSGPENPYLSHNHVANSVIYTGTHDNDTTLGWYRSCSRELQERVEAYLGYPQEVMPWPLIRSAFASVGRLAVVPMQDYLGLGSEARMNEPGTEGDNWVWRFDWGQVPPGLAEQLRGMADLYGRIPDTGSG